MKHLSVLLVCCMVLSLSAADEAPDQTSLAEAPHWPVGFLLTADVIRGWRNWERRLQDTRAHVLVWTPPGLERLRGALLIPNNTDSKHVGEHQAVREVAARHGLGIVYFRYLGGSVIERTEPPEQAEALMAAIMDQVAVHTGVDGYRHAPWITFGKSSRGRFPFRTTWWFPDRVIASITYHGETPTWPMPEWSRVEDQSVLHVAINGEREWDGTWYRHVRPCLLNYHLNTSWLAHMVVLPNEGHGNYVDAHGSPGWGQPVPEGRISCLRVWDYIALYIDRAMTLRVPADADAAAGPIALQQVTRDGGYLIHPRAPEELQDLRWYAFRYHAGAYRVIPWPDEPSPVHDMHPGRIDRELLIRPVSAVPEQERRHHLWIPDRDMLGAWLDLHGHSRDLMPDPE